MTIQQNFQKVNVTCSSNGKTVKADILQKNDKFLKIVLVGTDITLSLNRTDTNKVYIGIINGLEFTSSGEEVT